MAIPYGNVFQERVRSLQDAEIVFRHCLIARFDRHLLTRPAGDHHDCQDVTRIKRRFISLSHEDQIRLSLVRPTSNRLTGISRPTLRGSQHNAKRDHSFCHTDD